MNADTRFIHQSKEFWANVRSISGKAGYTDRRTKQIRVYSAGEMATVMESLGLGTAHLVRHDGSPSELAQKLEEYFEYRARVLNEYVRPRLMNVEQAASVLNQLIAEHGVSRALTMNKQKGEKRKPAYLTEIVNIVVEANSEGVQFNPNPLVLTTVVQDEQPIRTMARRVDGCFPSTVNPLAIWEIKEYYFTTTFGSRVADAVYETLLDGMELEEIRSELDLDIRHLLVVDAYYTWWDLGRSYLCRIIDMLHMGYVDEVLFGHEVVERLPALVKEWVAEYKARPNSASAPPEPKIIDAPPPDDT